MDLAMDLWHANSMKVISLKFELFEFLELFEPWTMLIVFFFLALILSIWLAFKPNNLRKLYCQISKKTWSNLHFCRKSPIKLVLFVCPSVSLSIHLWHIFLRIYSVGFLNFFPWGYFAIYIKKWQTGFWRIAFVV